ncbi:NADH-dependent flavin oxidoreductase [Ureibacillus chungkukjangi]|uniref:2,4-dienoyl-CoA reductase-like NADH-dependent reductase (Old Yellow Enzyme family) n=1 Tax=Ureibacillus chungkukjangi TaxID=1202712 RepID=A0A318TTU7_9BACL|nr:NADH-dependent flavin oxidoreductase [Ureibacillus chungkukjangi]PYF08291.1 2,4-dienoyl-CoA reductase-like NADH-dependent reductase (Old Yellow Enzyme family) [Ureibacillus chungkukjangi]
MNEKYKDLFAPFTLPNGIELKNRIVMAPMTHWSSNVDGTVTDAEIKYYSRRSNGVSLVITACTHVTANGQGFHGQFAAYNDKFIPDLKRVADAIKEQGAKAVLQIYHGGKMSPPELVPNGEIVSASDIPAEQNGVPGKTPRPLTEGEIEEIINAYGEATRRAIEAGYDGVEVHGANGYLIQQFFSGHSNRREDRFGGTLEKRMAFPLAVVDKVKSVVEKYGDSSFIVGHRFSPEEPEEKGITMADTLELVDALADKELDYLHVSLGDFFSTAHRGVDDLTKTRIAYLLEKINNRVPLIGVGSIYSAEDARKAFETGIPLLALGRELLIDPDWVQKVAEGKEDEIATKLDKEKQEELVIPDQLWKMIINRPGWVPGV